MAKSNRLTNIAAMGLASYWGGYLIADSALLQAPREAIVEILEPLAAEGNSVADTILDGIGCATCTGVWSGLGLWLVSDRRRLTLTDMVAAFGVAMLAGAVEGWLVCDESPATDSEMLPSQRQVWESMWKSTLAYRGDADG